MSREAIKKIIQAKVTRTVDVNKYSEMVRDLKKEGPEIIKSLDAAKVDLLHMGVLLSEESGEVLSHIKKHAFYNKELDIEGILLELGDVNFALQGIMEILQTSIDEVKLLNMEKLKTRYPEGKYSDSQANNRLDVPTKTNQSFRLNKE